MPSTLACPDESELLALVMGEPVAAAVTAHVAGCAICQAKHDRLRAEVASLQQNHGHGTTPPSNEHDPAVDHDGEPADAGTTQDWTPADPAGAPGSDPFGPEAAAAARERAEGQMEYVHGRNLEQYAGEEPVTQRRAAALVAKLAEVMAVAHRHGITHCDIKPKNILIDKLGEPRLIDFGMARLRHEWPDRAPSSWGGTVAYMAPEQARLEIDRIGPRSDIFALGGVLYFLLTGQAPFVGQTGDEVWARARRCGLKIDEPGALPLLAGEQGHLEARLNQPAYPRDQGRGALSPRSGLEGRRRGPPGRGPPGTRSARAERDARTAPAGPRPPGSSGFHRPTGWATPGLAPAARRAP